MAKKLLYFRHGVKKGAIIGKEGLDQTSSLAYMSHNYLVSTLTDVFHGPLYRTAQSALAFVAGIGATANIHEPIELVGTENLFAQMVSDEFRDAVKGGATNIEALVKTQDPENVSEWENMARAGVAEMLNAVADDGVGICFGHDPVIPLAARACGYDSPSLKELEYLIFTLDNDNIISVEDPRQ